MTKNVHDIWSAADALAWVASVAAELERAPLPENDALQVWRQHWGRELRQMELELHLILTRPGQG